MTNLKIKQDKRLPVVSIEEIKKECRVNKKTIAFSFTKICREDNYNFKCFQDKKNQSNAPKIIEQFFEKLRLLSSMTWEELSNKDKKSGYEYLNISAFEKSFINGLPYKVTKDEDIIVVRFNSQKCRLFLKRGTKCNRVAFVIGIDCKLQAYKH